MLQRAFEHVGEYLHVVVTVGIEAVARELERNGE
jgi:hypothetical protein